MSDEIGFTLRDGAELAGVDLAELWWRYFALGGSGDPLSLAQRLSGDIACGSHDHDLIAQALNEVFIDQGTDSFPVAYSHPVTYSHPLLPRVPRPVRSRHATALAWPAQARRDAAVARLRSAAAARRAASLHATAAQLMQASGQLQFARHARTRARLAQQRGAARSAA